MVQPREFFRRLGLVWRGKADAEDNQAVQHHGKKDGQTQPVAMADVRNGQRFNVGGGLSSCHDSELWFIKFNGFNGFLYSL